MLQHQVGMARRVDLQHFEALIDDNAVLARELASAQQRRTRQRPRNTHAAANADKRQIIQLRAQLVCARHASTAALREQLNAASADGCTRPRPLSS